jgi:hypothetical protein
MLVTMPMGVGHSNTPNWDDKRSREMPVGWEGCARPPAPSPLSSTESAYAGVAIATRPLVSVSPAPRSAMDALRQNVFNFFSSAIATTPASAAAPAPPPVLPQWTQFRSMSTASDMSSAPSSRSVSGAAPVHHDAADAAADAADESDEALLSAIDGTAVGLSRLPSNENTAVPPPAPPALSDAELLAKYSEELGDWQFSFEDAAPPRTDNAPAPVVSASSEYADIPLVQLDSATRDAVVADAQRRLRSGEVTRSLSFSSPLRRRRTLGMTDQQAPRFSLTELTAKSSFGLPYGRIPSLIMKLVKRLISTHPTTGCALDMEGILRISGSKKRTDEEIQRMAEGNLDFSATGPHDSSHILKQLLRLLDEPILTHKHSSTFMKIYRDHPAPEQAAERQSLYRMLLLVLHEEHFASLRYLLDFAALVVERSDRNKMDLSNVAKVLAPNLFSPSTDDKTALADNATFVSVFEDLFSMRDLIGVVPADMHRSAVQAATITQPSGGVVSSIRKRLSLDRRPSSLAEQNGHLSRESSSNSDTVPESAQNESGGGGQASEAPKRRRTNSIGMLVGSLRSLRQSLGGGSSNPAPPVDAEPAAPKFAPMARLPVSSAKPSAASSSHASARTSAPKRHGPMRVGAKDASNAPVQLTSAPFRFGDASAQGAGPMSFDFPSPAVILANSTAAAMDAKAAHAPAPSPGLFRKAMDRVRRQSGNGVPSLQDVTNTSSPTRGKAGEAVAPNPPVLVLGSPVGSMYVSSV